ncbi:MAG: hypothetical protein H6732_19350 [Alphaproteobacteria bacterium]|nr:hypothetical protein [Alphaproteobacteria bacterium]
MTHPRSNAVTALAVAGFFTCGTAWLAIPFVLGQPSTACATCKRPIGGTAPAREGALESVWRWFWALPPDAKRWIGGGFAVLLVGSWIFLAMDQRAARARDERRAAENQAVAAAAEAEAQQRRADLVADAPEVERALLADLAAVDKALGAKDIAGARALEAQWRSRAAPYDGIEEAEGIGAAVAELKCRAAWTGLPDAMSSYDAATKSKEYSRAEQAISTALLSAESMERECPEFASKIGLAAWKARANKSLARVAPKAASERKKAQDEAAAAEALRTMCGTSPTISSWDGELLGAARFLRESAHDPGSIEVTDCSRPVLTDACWRSRCKVRGKNAFGGTVLNIMDFWAATRGSTVVVLAAEEAE